MFFFTCRLPHSSVCSALLLLHVTLLSVDVCLFVRLLRSGGKSIIRSHMYADAATRSRAGMSQRRNQEAKGDSLSMKLLPPPCFTAWLISSDESPPNIVQGQTLQFWSHQTRQPFSMSSRPSPIWAVDLSCFFSVYIHLLVASLPNPLIYPLSDNS